MGAQSLGALDCEWPRPVERTGTWMCRRGSLSAAGAGGTSGQGAPVELTSRDRYILGAHYIERRQRALGTVMEQ